MRPDGMITLPLIGEIKAAGLTPVQLQDQVTAALKKLLADPQVTRHRLRGPESDV